MNKITINLRAEVYEKDGKTRLAFANPAYYQHQISQFKNDKKVLVTITNLKSQRSLNQNSYWHGVCFPILADLTGFTESEVKKWCTKLYIKPTFKILKGKEVEIPRGTSDLSKGEGVTFTNEIRAEAVELGGNIPTPCEAGFSCGRRDCDICSAKTDDKVIDYPENNLGEPTF